MRIVLGGFTAKYIEIDGENFIFISHVLSDDDIFCERSVLKDIETLQRTLVEFITYGSFMSDLEKMVAELEEDADANV